MSKNCQKLINLSSGNGRAFFTETEHSDLQVYFLFLYALLSTSLDTPSATGSNLHSFSCNELGSAVRKRCRIFTWCQTERYHSQRSQAPKVSREEINTVELLLSSHPLGDGKWVSSEISIRHGRNFPINYLNTNTLVGLFHHITKGAHEVLSSIFIQFRTLVCHQLFQNKAKLHCTYMYTCMCIKFMVAA